jgi:hypothetical protein
MTDCFEAHAIPDRARAIPGAGEDIFAFEQDFAGSLRCIPMIARFKLDLAGVKLTLRQWSQLDRPTRERLAHAGCWTAEEISNYRSTLIDDIRVQTDEPPKLFEPDPAPVWSDDARTAEAVVGWCARIGVAPPTDAQWRALSNLQRFTLTKLTRAGHDNDNFYPALVEFGLATTT